GQFAQGEGLAFRARGRAEAGDIAGQVPALALVQLVGEGRHVGALDTQAEGGEQVVKAEAIHPRDVAQVGRWRLQAEAGRAVAGPAVAVADGAVPGGPR